MNLITSQGVFQPYASAILQIPPDLMSAVIMINTLATPGSRYLVSLIAAAPEEGQINPTILMKSHTLSSAASRFGDLIMKIDQLEIKMYALTLRRGLRGERMRFGKVEVELEVLIKYVGFCDLFDWAGMKPGRQLQKGQRGHPKGGERKRGERPSRGFTEEQSVLLFSS